MHIPKRWLVFLFLSLVPCAAVAHAAAGTRWPLLAEVRVAGESIYLSDLLPSQTPPEIRDATGKISLGAAPQPGGTLIFSGEKIAGLVPEAARNEILIPPQVVVHRSDRLLTRAEVVAALRASLQSTRLPGASNMEPEDVHFSAPVHVSSADARLEVRRIDFDATLKQARFLLASAADRRALPFLVTAGLRSNTQNTSGDSGQILSAPQNLAGGNREAYSAKVSSEEIPLVEPRRLARLHVSSGSMQMLLDVVPLERGALHETVRVRLPGSGKILRGQVIAPGQLEAQF